jgi:hypothetical protein
MSSKISESIALKGVQLNKSPVESGSKILVYMCMKCIPVVLVVFDIFLIISNKINNK